MMQGRNADNPPNALPSRGEMSAHLRPHASEPPALLRLMRLIALVWSRDGTWGGRLLQTYRSDSQSVVSRAILLRWALSSTLCNLRRKIIESLSCLELLVLKGVQTAFDRRDRLRDRPKNCGPTTTLFGPRNATVELAPTAEELADQP